MRTLATIFLLACGGSVGADASADVAAADVETWTWCYSDATPFAPLHCDAGADCTACPGSCVALDAEGTCIP